MPQAEVTVAGWAGHAALRVINVTAVGGNRHVTVGAWARRQSSESESDRRRSSCGPGGCPAKRRRLPGPGGWLSPSPSPSRSHRDPAWRSLRLPVASELLAVAQGRASPPGPSAGPRRPKHRAQPGQGAWSGRLARPGVGRSVLYGTELGPGAGLTGAANCLAGPGKAAASAGRGPNGVLECWQNDDKKFKTEQSVK